MAERELANQLDGMTRSAVADQRIVDADLVPVLRFIGQVVVLVQQAFGDVLASLIEFSYLRAEDLREPRRTELLSSIDNLLARSRYRDVEEICSRLHSLSELFDQAVRPKLGRLAEESEWGQVFELLEPQRYPVERRLCRRWLLGCLVQKQRSDRWPGAVMELAPNRLLMPGCLRASTSSDLLGRREDK